MVYLLTLPTADTMSTARRLGGVVVSVLATGPKVCEFEPGQGDGFLRAIKIRSTPSFGWEVKPEVPCRKILRHVRSLEVPGDGSTKFSFPSPTLRLAPEMFRVAGPPDSTGGCQRSLLTGNQPAMGAAEDVCADRAAGQY
jgi:hypothetical protein